ncbi:hypothetical protein [Collinsella intestinalis]|uniref:hypothetical protein n=1 Tax=Collinsella intestinalis TaxID=147207 RepID=UPI001EF5EBD6|nr:hypothetical protein [Collinsella intestinalis]
MAETDVTLEPMYRTVTTLGDFGPWISRLVLELPDEIGVNDVTTATFNVFCTRRERTGAVLMRKERGADHAAPSTGYVPVLAAYPATPEGKRAEHGSHVALELPEVRLTKRVEGGVMGSRKIDNCFRITQTTAIPTAADPLVGLVYDACAGDICPALDRWHEAEMTEAVDGIKMEYGYFEPDFEPAAPAISGHFTSTKPKPEKAALIVYLHGAGEGKGESEDGGIPGGPLVPEGPARAYTGNRVTALSQSKIQDYFDGAAWVLVPQCPTFWMDNGVEQLGHSNQSIYARALKALIDEFIAAHADRIDTSRIVVGGLSNGGFMTLRMCLDYPGFFAAGLPCCAPWFNATAEDVAGLAQTPLWFTHSKGDELVDPKETVLPLRRALAAAGATVHCTYFDHVEDLTGVYREADGSPKKTFNHGVWIHVFNDFCRTDIDGTNVMIDGEPVGMWEWAARQRA